MSLQFNFVGVSHRNLLKAIYAFMNVDLAAGALVPLKTMERLASLGSRYGNICRLMRPFVRVLYSSYRGKSRFVEIELGLEAKAVIRLFRCLFVAQALDKVRFSRSLDSFMTRLHTWVAEFDASLTGVGIIWFRLDHLGRECAMAYSSVDITFLGFEDDSSFQNTAEFLGLLLCIHGMHLMGVSHEPTLARGDSVSALSWAKKGSVRSDLAVRAAMLYAMYAVTHETDIVGTTHLSHEDNSRTDILSRPGGTWDKVLIEDRQRYTGLLQPDVPFLDLNCHGLLVLCDPKAPLDSDDAFCEFFQAGLAYMQQPPHSSAATSSV
jgi:hypothetical protein